MARRFTSGLRSNKQLPIDGLRLINVANLDEKQAF